MFVCVTVNIIFVSHFEMPLKYPRVMPGVSTLRSDRTRVTTHTQQSLSRVVITVQDMSEHKRTKCSERNGVKLKIIFLS